MPLPDVDRLAKMIPALPLGFTIDKTMYGWPEKDHPGNPELRSEYENNPAVTRLIDTARKLEGISRHASVHAAGVMISEKPLIEYTPLVRNADGALVTQYPHSSLEDIGLLKMDFLGLSNLTILARAVKMIKERRGVDIDVWNIPLDYSHPDAKRAYDMLGRSETTGIFQLESQGMRKYIIDLKPNSVKELAAMVALYRPGPMAHIPRYIRGKFNPDTVKYTHPLLEPILKETYGVIVYQDQVLKIVQAVAGFSLGQADLLRRAMGKKKASEMEKQKENFLKGAKEKGVSVKDAEQIFSEIEPFAGYAFNGAHAACYAAVSFQTAYLKANYPAEYLSALMGTYIDTTEKVVLAIEECARMSVKVLAPDVNDSEQDFTVEGEAVRFGMLAIKNVGKAPIEHILVARSKGGRFLSLEDFCTRVFAEGLTSRSVIEMLIKAGALNSIHPNRRALIDRLDDCCAAAIRGAKDAATGQTNMFDQSGESGDPEIKVVVAMPDLPDFSRGERLQMEKELLGLYLSEHPLKPFEPELRRKYRALPVSEMKETQPNQSIVIGGIVTNTRTIYTKTGQPMLVVTLEDTSGTISATCFTKATTEYGKFLTPNAVVAIWGRAQHRERMKRGGGGGEEEEAEEKSVQIEVMVDRVEQIIADAMAADARPRQLHVHIDSSCKTFLRMLKETLAVRQGGSPLYLHIDIGDGKRIKVKANDTVAVDDGIIAQVRQMLGGGTQRVWVE